jgi:hypothetical protein
LIRTSDQKDLRLIHSHFRLLSEQTDSRRTDRLRIVKQQRKCKTSSSWYFLWNDYGVAWLQTDILLAIAMYSFDVVEVHPLCVPA